MAIDETGLTKGQVRKLNALRKSVGGDLAEEVFARWLEREAASSARSKHVRSGPRTAGYCRGL